MDLRQLSYFVAVAEERQFTRASVRVSVAQPAVSAQVRRLERELGEALFHRDQRAVTLTEAGQALLPHARAALAAADRGRDTIASLRGLLKGRLRIGVSRPVDRRIAQTLGAFHRAHPAIELAFTEQHNEPLIAAVAAGDIDVAAVGLAGGDLPAQVKARVIDVEPLVLVTRSGHPLSRHETISIGRLRDQPMITLMRGSGLRTVLEDACAKAGFAPRIAVETGELPSLLELTAEGLGVAIVPRSAIGDAAVVVVEITRPRLKRRTALVWNHETSTPAARAFLALADERFPSASKGRRRKSGRAA